MYFHLSCFLSWQCQQPLYVTYCSNVVNRNVTCYQCHNWNRSFSGEVDIGDINPKCFVVKRMLLKLALLSTGERSKLNLIIMRSFTKTDKRSSFMDVHLPNSHQTEMPVGKFWSIIRGMRGCQGRVYGTEEAWPYWP